LIFLPFIFLFLFVLPFHVPFLLFRLFICLSFLIHLLCSSFSTTYIVPLFLLHTLPFVSWRSQLCIQSLSDLRSIFIVLPTDLPHFRLSDYDFVCSLGACQTPLGVYKRDEIVHQLWSSQI
jgi:hypothetical protein